jgi:hypothetical protein
MSIKMHLDLRHVLGSHIIDVIFSSCNLLMGVAVAAHCYTVIHARITHYWKWLVIFRAAVALVRLILAFPLHTRCHGHIALALI